MPSVISFDAFLRWRSKPTAKPPLPATEDDSDRSSSPEELEPRRISFHISTPKSSRQLPDRPRDVQKALPGIPTASKLFPDEVVNEKSRDHFLEQPVEATEKLVGLLR